MQHDMNSEIKPSAPRRRSGGSSSRKERQAVAPIPILKHLVCQVPTYELETREGIELIDDAAMRILETVGITFTGAEWALDLWRSQGARVEGERAYIPRELMMQLIRTVPEEFDLHSRNPDRRVRVGGRNTVFHPQGGAYFTGFDQVRRRPVRDDLVTVTKLNHLLPAVHVTAGWPAFDLSDVPVVHRHLDQIHFPLRYSDKPLTANSYDQASARDAIEMVRIVYGADFVDENAVVVTLTNCNTPLKYDGSMLEGLREFAQAGQPVICSPFVLFGASTPPNTIGAVAQVVAEGLAGVALTQIIRPGTPALFGIAPFGVSMKTGAPNTAIPEVAQMAYITGQMARFYKLPLRISGPKTGSKIADFCAGSDSSIRAYIAILCGANWISHCAGSLESGMQLNLGKAMLDEELMRACYAFANGADRKDLDICIQMMRSLGGGSHFLGEEYTLTHMPFTPELQDNEVHDSWVEAGSLSGVERGFRAAKALLERYQEPGFDPEIDAALNAYKASRGYVV